MMLTFLMVFATPVMFFSLMMLVPLRTVAELAVVAVGRIVIVIIVMGVIIISITGIIPRTTRQHEPD